MHYTTLDSIPVLYQLDDNCNIYLKFFKLISFWLSELQHTDLHWVFVVIFKLGIFKLGSSTVLFPWWLSGKEPACQCRRCKRYKICWEDPLE